MRGLMLNMIGATHLTCTIKFNKPFGCRKISSIGCIPLLDMKNLENVQCGGRVLPSPKGCVKCRGVGVVL